MKKASTQLSTLYHYFECVGICIQNSVCTLNRHQQLQIEFLVFPLLSAFPISVDGNSILLLAQVKTLCVSSLSHFTLSVSIAYPEYGHFLPSHCHNTCLFTIIFSLTSAIDSYFIPLPLRFSPHNLVDYSEHGSYSSLFTTQGR